MQLSIIIPVFNEAKKIRSDLISLRDFLIINNYQSEIIISDDGSTDETAEISKKISFNSQVALIILKGEKHYGKGHAVRKGIIKSKGKIVLYIDSGDTISMDNIMKGINMIQNKGYKIVLGSRHLPNSIIRKNLVWYRRLTSILFKVYSKTLFPSLFPFSDTQCGFKIFDGRVARDLFSKGQIDGFLFDIEIIRHAKKKKISINEMPIEWTCDRDSRLYSIPTIWEIFRDSLKLKISS